MIQQIINASEFYIKDFTTVRLEPFNTYQVPFTFINSDETPYDIEEFEFLLTIYKGKRDKLEFNDNNFVKSINNLWLDIPVLDLDTGVYNYRIKIVGYNSIISGKLKIV